MRTGWLSTLALAMTCLVATSAAHADPPACRVEGSVVRVRMPSPLDGSISQIASIAVAEDRTMVVMRVLPRRPRGVTRVLVGTFDDSGTWTEPPHEITNFPARLDGAIAIARSGEWTRVLVAGARTLRSVRWHGSDPPAVTNLSSATRFADRVASFTSLGDRFRLVWTTPRGLEVQDIAADDSADGTVGRVRVPERTRVASIAGGPEETTGLVMQTSARRYVIATLDADARFHWTGNAPAGCSQHFCAGVQLHAAPHGFVATWLNRRGRDGLATPGGWALDANGHGIGGRREFLAMRRGLAIAGPTGEPLALQLARPVVLRGAAAPIAIADTESHPSRVRPYVAGASPHGTTLAIIVGWDDGSLTQSRVRCDE
jgi:hypothetical protein